MYSDLIHSISLIYGIRIKGPASLICRSEDLACTTSLDIIYLYTVDLTSYR